MTESDILYQRGKYWVTNGRRKDTQGFKVIEDVGVCGVVVAWIGYDDEDGLRRAKAECDKRAEANK